MGEQLIKCYAVSLPNENDNYNQDNIYMNGKYIINEQKSEDFSYSGRYRDPIQIFAISDGFGHGEKGAIASAAVMQILKVLQKRLAEEENLTIHKAREMISDFILDTNNKICLYKEQAKDSKIGTTLAALFIFGDKAFTVHLGDSRVYRFRNNRLQQITEDHLECNSLVKLGIISTEQANIHKVRSKLTKYFGLDEEEYRLTATYSEIFDLEAGDLLFLSSDGLTDQIGNRIMENTINENNKDEVLLTKTVFNHLCHRQTDISMLMLNVDEVVEGRLLGGKLKESKVISSINKTIEQVSQGEGDNKKLAIVSGLAVAIVLSVVILLFAAKGLMGSGKDEEALSNPPVEEQTKEPQVVEEKPVEPVVPVEEEPAPPQEPMEPETTEEEPSTDETAAGLPTTYTVQSGDNLFKIAKNFYGEEKASHVRKIAYINGIEDPSNIFVGQELKLIPDSGQITYKIEAGDTIYSISMRFFGSKDKELEIIRINQIDDINDLLPGTEIKIP